jgi:hypothetical protein
MLCQRVLSELISTDEDDELSLMFRAKGNRTPFGDKSSAYELKCGSLAFAAWPL